MPKKVKKIKLRTQPDQVKELPLVSYECLDLRRFFGLRFELKMIN